MCLFFEIERSLLLQKYEKEHNVCLFDRMTFLRVDQLPFLWSAGMSFSF